VQRIGELAQSAAAGGGGFDVEVVRNDAISVEQAEAMKPTHLLISPGPCTPNETGVCGALINHFQGRIPILGVCLGHQLIAHLGGMKWGRHSKLMHGKTSQIYHDGRGIYQGLSNPFTATRYHSLIVFRESVPDDYQVSAWTDEDEVMGLRWKGGGANDAPFLEGVQFHPESFLTIEGPALLANFLGLPRPATKPDRVS
jgi:anthranilate synthase component 2/para-aminobenzoate synthetase component 2